MPLIRSTLHGTLSAAIVLGFFGSMCWMLDILPDIEPYAFTPGPERSVVFVADLDALVEDALGLPPPPAPPVEIPEDAIVVHVVEQELPAAAEESVPEDALIEVDILEEEPPPVLSEDTVAAATEEGGKVSGGEEALPEAPVETIEVAGKATLPRKRVPGHPGLMTLQERMARAAAAQAPGDGKTSARPPKRRTCAEEIDAIQKLSEDSYEVERDLVDYYTNDISEAMKLAYVSWFRKDGEIIGFKVNRIKCGTVLHQAGFRNGDVITAINGKPVTSIPQALNAYRKLRNKKKLEVDLTRRNGEVVQLRYRLS